MPAFYNKIFFVLFFILSGTYARVYTLDELLEVAVKNSKQLRSIEKEIQKADAEVQMAIGSALPQISTSFNLSYSKSYNPFSSYNQDDLAASMDRVLSDTSTGVLPGDQRAFAQTLMAKSLSFSSELMNPPSNTASIMLNLNQPIYAQGKVGVGIKISKLFQRTLLCKHYQEKMKLRSEVATIFYTALLAQKNVEIVSEAVTLAEQTHRMALITHAVGKASELDTLTSLLHLQTTNIEQKKAQSNKRMVFEKLITVTGIAESPATFFIEGEFPEAEFNLTLDEVLVKVRKESPFLEQLKGKSEIQKQLIELGKTEFYPTVYGGGSIGKIGQFDGLNDLSNANWGNDLKVYIGLTWNIFTGLSRNYKLRQATLDAEIFQISEQAIMEDLELQTRNAYELVILSRDNLVASRSLITLAEKSYSIAQKAYEIGSRTLLELQDTELKLNQARIGLNTALYQFHVAVISLKLLMADI